MSTSETKPRYGSLPKGASVPHPVGREEATRTAIEFWNGGPGRGWPATKRGWRVWMRPETPETVPGAPGPWVEVDGRTREIIEIGDPRIVPIHTVSSQRRAARYFAAARRLLRLPSLRIDREEALRRAERAYEDRYGARRIELGRVTSVPQVREGLRNWNVRVRPGDKPGINIEVNGQSGEIKAFVAPPK